MKPTILLALTLGVTSGAFAEPIAPHLKVALCTGDFGMWAQDRVPQIQNGVAQAAPGSNVAWEVNQSYNFTRRLEDAAWLHRFDVVVIGDVGIGQLTPRAQENLVNWIQGGGGLVWVNVAKSTLPFKGAPEAVAMPLEKALPVQYPDFSKPASDAQVTASTDPFFAGIDFSALTEEAARKNLGALLVEKSFGQGRVLMLQGAFGRGYKRIAYATYEPVAGGWADFPGLGEIWTRVLNRASASSTRRQTPLETLDRAFQGAKMPAQIKVDARQTVDQIRAANFSIVALQQLYNEDGGAGEDLFLALNPRDWFDRRSQEVMPNTKGVKSDKPALFREYGIKGIYMADNSYGSYGDWDDARYAKETQNAVTAAKNYGDIIPLFQAGNEPPLDQKYVKFHQRFVGDVLKAAPNFKVIGPNKAFNLFGVDPAAMQMYLDECGKTTDVLNWHTYAQPPSTVLAEARYWSGRATGKLRTPGVARVMFTESDAWNQGDSQFNYLMERAFTFLPEPRIIANFQYCMRPRTEGGTYRFGVLQPEGLMSANYNGYWIWRDLRGTMTRTQIEAPRDKTGSLRAISSRSKDGKTLTTVVYFGAPFYDQNQRFEGAKVNLNIQLPPGKWRLSRSQAAWDGRVETPAEAKVWEKNALLELELAPYEARALKWTRE